MPERITRDGSVLVPLDEAKAREQVAKLKEAGVESVAVCFLFSFLNPEHEARVAEIVREEFPDAFLSVSSEVLPAVPRVRALLDRLPERVHRPPRVAATSTGSRRSSRRWTCAPGCT